MEDILYLLRMDNHVARKSNRHSPRFTKQEFSK
jgi:hypothetical protein